MSCADLESFVRGHHFLVDKGSKDPNTTIISPPGKRHLNGVSVACR